MILSYQYKLVLNAPFWICLTDISNVTSINQEYTSDAYSRNNNIIQYCNSYHK